MWSERATAYSACQFLVVKVETGSFFLEVLFNNFWLSRRAIFKGQGHMAHRTFWHLWCKRAIVNIACLYMAFHAETGSFFLEVLSQILFYPDVQSSKDKVTCPIRLSGTCGANVPLLILRTCIRHFKPKQGFPFVLPRRAILKGRGHMAYRLFWYSWNKCTIVQVACQPLGVSLQTRNLPAWKFFSIQTFLVGQVHVSHQWFLALVEQTCHCESCVPVCGGSWHTRELLSWKSVQAILVRQIHVSYQSFLALVRQTCHCGGCVPVSGISLQTKRGICLLGSSFPYKHSS